MTISETELGKVVRSGRRKAGMTQKELAVAIGVNQKAISHIEVGRTVSLKATTAAKLSDVLDIEIDKLLPGVSLSDAKSDTESTLDRLKRQFNSVQQ